MFNFMKKGVGVGSSNSSNSNSGEKDRSGSFSGFGGSFVGGGITGSVGGGGGGGGDRGLNERDDKDKRKKEKKLRKIGKQTGNMTAEDLLRLDEVHRTLKIRGRRKEKEKLPSGITADYSAEFFAQLDIDRRINDSDQNQHSTTMENNNSYNNRSTINIGNSDSSETSLNFIGNNNTSSGGGSTSGSTITGFNPTSGTKSLIPPPVPPKPPKRGILKGHRSAKHLDEMIPIVTTSDHHHHHPHQQPTSYPSTNSTFLIQNEHNSYDNVPSTAITQIEISHSNNTNNHHLYNNNLNISNNSNNSNELSNTFRGGLNLPSPSLSADDSLTDTTNSFATPPFSLSPVGESQGSHRWSRVQAFEDIVLPLPEIKIINLPPPRELLIKRQKSARNDFGFSLRKAMCLDRTESLFSPIFKPVIFAEPGAGGSSTGLLPGDRLLKVNGTSVENLPRETIIEMIKNCHDSVTVTVQPVSELVELSKRCIIPINNNTYNQNNSIYNNINSNSNSNNNHLSDYEDDKSQISNCNTLKRSASKRFKTDLKSNEELVKYDQHVWFLHKEGFCDAIRLKKEVVEPGKVCVQFVHNGEEFIVDEDEIEKANSPLLDLAEDICQFKHLNEASVLHCLRQRYASNLVHTRAGPTMLVVNPMAPLSLYSEKVVSMFRGCKTEDMPPHVYSLAQTAYRNMLETRQDQSLIFMGRSGSGKTTSFKHSLYYLTLAAGSVNKLITVEKINAINTILEAFGNTKTCLNSNATRFTQIFSLDFDHSGMIVSGSIQILLLERTRAGRRNGSNDHPFNVMTLLLAGVESVLQKELHLENISNDENNPFITLSQKLEDRQKAASDFRRLAQAFITLNVDSSQIKIIWYILAASYHLGVAGVSKIGSGPSARIQFANSLAANRAADLLGVKLEQLTEIAFKNISTSSSGGGGSTGSSPVRSPIDTTESAWDSLEALIIGLYSEVTAATVALINKSIGSTLHSNASILLIDTPGFQNPATCGIQSGATLSDLQHNYLQERLQLLYNHVMLVAPRDRYAQELVEIDIEDFQENHSIPLVNLIDKAPQGHLVVRTSQRDLREQDRRGLLWLLDEESIHPNSNDDTFIERLLSHYGDREYQYLIRRGVGSRQFIIQHLQGTNPVLYSGNGWLKQSREHPTMKMATTLLQDSLKDDISRLFSGTLARRACVMFFNGNGGSIVGLDGNQSLRRVSSIRKSFVSAGVKRNSVMLQVKFSVDGLIDTLRRTGTHFIHCLLLQHNAGTNTIIKNNNNSGFSSQNDIVNVPLLRSQIRGANIIEAARLHRLGFPESVPLPEFFRRFGLLIENGKNGTVEQILSNQDVDSSAYRVGPSQVLLRCGILNQLEAKRDELLTDRIIQIQAYSRGYLLRKRIAQRRVQELAVRCIQRNVRAFMTVKEWPWWRLFVHVAPLLNVHRTEEQLKKTSDDLQMLKLKLEKIENERNQLRNDKNILETKLSEMTIDLTEERSASNIVTERLELETAERLKLEKQLQEQQDKIQTLQDTSEKLEMELICAKSDLNGISEDDDLDNDETGSSSVYRLKYERLAKELEYTKRRLQTQHEHDLEQLVGLKKQLEKKLADAYEEVEEQRQVVTQWKRKVQKLSNEMNDLRMLLEQQNERNNLLEKRQRKFDLECQSLQDATRQERQARERLSREKDVLIAEKFTLEQNLADSRLELDMKEEKYASLQREYEELSYGGGTEEEISQLKRAKLDSERKCKDQEEELDELAGQIQILEQTKLRLEMSLETMRKEARREAQQRDEELEEARGSSFKKMKVLECQLENEHEERTQILREKHELERRLQNVEELYQMSKASEDSVNQKLKRDLRKYKALLKDAQIQLERAKTETPGKIVIRQLRNQIEDAETARDMAIKSKQIAENELADLQVTYDEAVRTRSDAEDKSQQLQRDRNELQTQLEENEEEMSEVMKKYSTTVRQLNSEQLKISEYDLRINELESEKHSLKEQVDELHSRLENMSSHNDPLSNVVSKRLELRVKELESRLELEQATRGRIEIQSNRHKDSLEKAQSEIAQAKSKEILAIDGQKKLQKNIRELRENLQTALNREQDSVCKRKELEKRIESAEAESVSVKNDLRLALQRISDLQQAMEEGDEDSSDNSNTSDESLSDQDERIYTRKFPKTNNIDNLSVNLNNGKKFGVSSSSCSSVSGDNIKNGESSSYA